jgi:L-alanine-DL-glutamate epimerase-like enolase superfamily enzyme
MMQVHLHLYIAHRACSLPRPGRGLLEYIPWLRGCFEEPATVQDGYFVPPRLPGAGTTLTERALTEYRV